MPIRDLPQWYPLDPELRDVSSRLKDKAEAYLSEAIECCEALSSRNDPNDLLSICNDLIAVQVNVAARRLKESVDRLTLNNPRPETHEYYVSRILDDVL